MKYDLVIIGAGPAGLTAGIYAARYGLKCVIIGKIIGGLVITAHKVCNFPGYAEVPGFELMKKMKEQVEKLDVEIVQDGVLSIEGSLENFKIKTELGKEFNGKRVLLGLGTERKKLGLVNESKYVGKGVSYCVTCDGSFYKGKKVVVVGGSNAALTSALYLSDICSKVYLVYRKGEFVRAEQTWVDLVEKRGNIEIIFEDEVVELKGEGKIEGVDLKSGRKLEISGVFVEVGSVPENELGGEIGVDLNDEGYIIVDKEGKTNVEGVYAAGDVTDCKLKQIITACAQGSEVVYSIYNEVLKGKV